MKSDDSSTLLEAAVAAHPTLGSDDVVHTKVELAERLRVSRQSIHAWTKLEGAPPRIAGVWSFQTWLDFVDARGLAAGRSIERTQALVEMVTFLAAQLPAHVSRKRLRRFKAEVRRALRAHFPATRFLSATSDASPHAKRLLE